MNVSVEHLSSCKKLVRVELTPEEVEKVRDEVVRDTVRRVNIPGFRPGKAPRSVVMSSFKGHIETELKRKIVPDAYWKAMRQEKLRPMGQPDIEEGVIQEGKPYAITFTVEIEPAFELPDYRNLPIRPDPRTVTEEDVTRALEVLRAEKGRFVDCARQVQRGDYVVVNYTATCDGKPITDVAPTATGLTEKKGFWLHVAEGEFIPGFTEQLVGASAGEQRTVTVTFPSDFVVKELCGRIGVYSVEIVQVKERVFPALGDELAREYGADTFESLKAGVRHDLEMQLAAEKKRRVRDQLVATLLGRVSCDLPEDIVQQETKNVVYDLVRANQERGVPKEAIDERKDEIFTVATNSARERVKATILLRRIAEEEKIEATDDEVAQRIMQLAYRHGIKPQKLAEQLRERNAIGQIRQEILEAKVLDALELYARVEEPPPPTA